MPLKRISTIHNVQWRTRVPRVQQGDLAKELALLVRAQRAQAKRELARAREDLKQLDEEQEEEVS